MIVLDATTKSLRIRLSAAGGAPEFAHQWDVSWAEFDQATQAMEAVGSNSGTINDTAEVDLVAAPLAGKYRKILFLSVQNYGIPATTAVEVLKDISGANTVLRRALLQMFDTLIYADGEGWSTSDVTGARKEALAQPTPMVVGFLTQGTDLTWTNMPAALTFFNGSHRFVKKLDLTRFSQVRVQVNKQGVAGAAASAIRLLYSPTYDLTVANWLTIGTSEVQALVAFTNQLRESAWINLAAGAKVADAFVTIAGISGDGALDPAFGNICAQFR